MTNFLCSIIVLLSHVANVADTQKGSPLHSKADTLKIKRTVDFELKGDGSASNWNSSEWMELSKTGGSVSYKTRAKMLYSDSGIYCLYHCEDNKITATLQGDFLDLWNEDVVEAFFWTDESNPIYFEYELSPLNYELPILVPNNKGKFLGWLPWHYEGSRKTRHAIHVDKNGSAVTSWTAEFFIPFALLKPLNNVPPRKGTHWRANFYRIDHDSGESSWEWRQVRDQNFHDYELFGYVVFD